MWTPKEIRKLIALLCGVGIEIAGVWLLVNQIQTTGSIDISSGLISGKIQSGSAGLLICFLGLFVIIFSIIGGRDLIGSYKVSESLTQERVGISLDNIIKKHIIIIIISGIFVVGLIFGGEYLLKVGWQDSGTLLFVLGVICAVLEIILISNTIYEYMESISIERNSKQVTKDKEPTEKK